MVPIAELEAAQADASKSESELKRGIQIMEKVSDLGEQAAADKEASERFLLEIANALAEAGLDVSNLIELAQTVGGVQPVAEAQSETGPKGRETLDAADGVVQSGHNRHVSVVELVIGEVEEEDPDAAA